MSDDYLAIQRLTAIYSQLLDDKRFDEWIELFTPDAVFAVWGERYVGRDAILAAIGGMQPDHPGKHVSFAVVADIDGAQAKAWVDLTGLADAGPNQWGRGYSVVTAGRYYDTLVKIDGRWFYRERLLRMAYEPLPTGATPTPAR